MKAKKCCWILVGILVVSCGVLWASSQNWRRKYLEGVPGVHVLVNPIDPEAGKYGLTKENVQNDTELLLRQYGVKILSREEAIETDSYPRLFVSVNIHINDTIAAIAIEVELVEEVILQRKPPKLCPATIWETGYFGLVSTRILGEVRKNVKDQVEIFINNYLAANPKEQPPQQKTEK